MELISGRKTDGGSKNGGGTGTKILECIPAEFPGKRTRKKAELVRALEQFRNTIWWFPLGFEGN